MIGALDIPRDSKKAMIGALGIPTESNKEMTDALGIARDSTNGVIGALGILPFPSWDPESPLWHPLQADEEANESVTDALDP